MDQLEVSIKSIDLVVEDAEPQPRLPLGQQNLLHVPGPGGGVREDLQRPRPGHHALPGNDNAEVL